MKKALLLISSVAPYNRGGFHFPMIAGQRHATIVTPLADVSDVHLEQLVADPNVVVVPIAEGAFSPGAYGTPAERVAHLRGGATDDHDQRFAALVEREGFAAQYRASLDQRAAALDVRQAALEVREEEHGRAVTATLRPTYTGALGDQGDFVSADRAAADVPPRALANLVEANRDEAVDHHGAANTPAQHLADEIEAGLVEVVEPPIDREGLAADELVEDAQPKPARKGGRFAKTTE